MGHRIPPTGRLTVNLWSSPGKRSARGIKTGDGPLSSLILRSPTRGGLQAPVAGQKELGEPTIKKMRYLSVDNAKRISKIGLGTVQFGSRCCR